jgi:hypothetical protein
MPSSGLHYNERGILAVNTIPWYHFVRVPYILNPEEMCNFEFASNEHRFLTQSFCICLYFMIEESGFGTDSEPDPYLVLMDPDPGGPKTSGSGSETLRKAKKILDFYSFVTS